MIKLFIQNAGSFDFAFLAQNFAPIGRSFSVDVAFEGHINSNGMIMDFSDAKKIVKLVLKEFDHKLLAAKENIKHKTKSSIIVSSQFKTALTHRLPEEQMSFFAIKTKRDWVNIIEYEILYSLENNNTDSFETLIAENILKYLPKNIFNVVVKFNKKSVTQIENKVHDGFLLSQERSFYYTHSLCNHSGDCQRFHGHSAQVHVLRNQIFDTELSTLAEQKINGMYMISERHLCSLSGSQNINQIKKYCFDKNQFERTKNDLCAIEYKGSSGLVSLILSKHLAICLKTDSTIENITRYVYEYLIDLLGCESKNSNIHIAVSMYEGLSKGAAIE